MEMSQSQRRRVDGICHHIDEYLTLRLAHAERVNPKIGHFMDDLKAQVLVNLRETLTKARAWGTDKMMIADVICGDDLTKRYDVFNMTGQYSILHDIVTSLDDHQRGADAIRITDLRMLYMAIDSAMGGLIELSQTWIWWDLPDAVALHCHNSQVARIKKLIKMELNEQIKEYYKNAMNISGGEDIDMDMIMGHEYRRLMRIVTEFELRRRDDLSHQQVLKRDVLDDKGVNALIIELAEEVRLLEKIEGMETIPEDLQSDRARKMGADPNKIDRDHIVLWQRRHVAEMENQTHTALLTGQVLGPPYNFKVAQLEQMKTDVKSIQPLISEGARHAADVEEASEASGEQGGPMLA